LRLLFHCCCAPCASACVPSLRGEGIEPVLFWFNPNIHPCTEYRARLDTFVEFAANEKLETEIIDEYGLRPFLEEVFPLTDKRCEKCYKIRLEKTASFAAQNGYASFGTSLLVSPYQDHDALRRAGENAAAKYGVEFFYKDFRPLFREGQAKAREKGMYMQKYCGCIFSEEERYLQKNTHGDTGDAEIGA
jgi:predicted adenine nucleotide alpha hydrolase (AANH) superfamily ATPase